MPSRFASSAWSVSGGEVLQDELAAAAACFFRCLLLLLQHAPGAAVARGYTHALQMMYPSVCPARGNVVSTGKKSGLRQSRGKLGQSKASGKLSASRMKRSTLISPINGSNIICFPNTCDNIIYAIFA